MYLGYLLSWLHPILVHFPIVLLLSACAVEIAGMVSRKSSLRGSAKWLLASGCVISLFAFVSGNFSEVFAVRGGTPHDPVDLHAIWAMITTWCFILLTIVRFYLDPEKRPAFFKIYLAGLLLSSGFLIYTGHQGGELVYAHGANVASDHPAHALDMKDLRDLYQEQTMESIVYSEMMHHIFGWLVLALSLFIIFSKIWPKQSERFWKGGPYVLLAGGAFLMIFSDTDAWPLSNARPLYDKEVLQHKIFAMLMLSGGLISIFRKKKEKAPASSNYHLGLALLALVGGGLLFTHVHSVAPYSNRAIGVYLHHLTMGFFAVSAGAVSMWEALKPGPRWRTFLWPAILLVESVLLIKYNEDIPWFIRLFSKEIVQVNHSPDYELKLETFPVVLEEGKTSQLRFQLVDTVQHKTVSDLEIVHENPQHLMIVSKDLSFFDHIHPMLQKDGSLTLDYRFPSGGEFILFSDFVPKGQTTQSFRTIVNVKGNEKKPEVLSETVYQTLNISGREVLLFTKPYLPSPGQPAHLRFALYEKDKGITDLELFLGCFGHCIIISQDTEYYLHTHPEGHHHGNAISTAKFDEFETVSNADSLLPKLGIDRQMMFTMGMTSPSMKYSGPEVVFPAVFPKSGLYKVWGQFRHRGEVLTVPFVVRVP
jgi:uncharacterized membrane protein